MIIKETEHGFRIWVALGERSISREIILDRYEQDEVVDEIVGAEPCALSSLMPKALSHVSSRVRSRPSLGCRPVVLAERNPMLLDRVGGKSATDVIQLMASNGYLTRRLRGASAEYIERYDEPATINVIFSPDR